MSNSSGQYCYDHPRPALTADVVLLKTAEGADIPSEILLIQRGHPPFSGEWALPGGFVEEGESPREAALRELAEETHVKAVEVQQVGAYGQPGRDPRGWVVSVAYLAVVPAAQSAAAAGDDASDLRWWPLKALPPLAFDHALIIESALDQLGLAEP